MAFVNKPGVIRKLPTMAKTTGTSKPRFTTMPVKARPMTGTSKPNKIKPY